MCRLLKGLSRPENHVIGMPSSRLGLTRVSGTARWEQRSKSYRLSWWGLLQGSRKVEEKHQSVERIQGLSGREGSSQVFLYDFCF